MEAICIETEHTNPEMLRKRLLQQIETWRSNGLLQEFNETSSGTITIWDCKAENNSQAKNLRRLAAQVLADYIVSEIEPVMLKKLASLHHPHFGEEEMNTICDKVRQRMVREEMLTGECRRLSILKKINDFLKTQEQINIEGFIRFRLQGYQRELLNLLNQSADDFMIEREYQDFINLLKYFVEIQHPRFPEMHLLREQNYFVLCDPSFKVLHKETIQDIEGSDAIVSTLVTAAPKQVTVHISQFDATDELVSTIHNIFESRVSLCMGCEHCQKH
jgi:putative sporulation protein YtxC